MGARQHIVGPLAVVDQPFAENQLDAILCNGVFGCGLDAPEEVEDSFGKCHRCLRRFRPFEFPPLSAHRRRVDSPSRHTFGFYVKP